MLDHGAELVQFDDGIANHAKQHFVRVPLALQLHVLSNAINDGRFQDIQHEYPTDKCKNLTHDQLIKPRVHPAQQGVDKAPSKNHEIRER